jgi:histidinol phosphatase-like enzyme
MALSLKVGAQPLDLMSIAFNIHGNTVDGIANYFGRLILSAECGPAKSAPGIFQLACDSMGVAPSQAVYVGDKQDIDAETARRIAGKDQSFSFSRQA